MPKPLLKLLSITSVSLLVWSASQIQVQAATQKSEAFQSRVCARVEKFENRSSVHARIVERIQRRFGFSCVDTSSSSSSASSVSSTVSSKATTRNRKPNRRSLLEEQHNSSVEAKQSSSYAAISPRSSSAGTVQTRTTTITGVRSRNELRESYVKYIANGLFRYAAKNDGVLPSCVTNVPTGICLQGTDCENYNGGRYGPKASCNIDETVEAFTSFARIPREPGDEPEGTVSYSGFDVQLIPGNMIQVSAPFAENNARIVYTRSLDLTPTIEDDGSLSLQYRQGDNFTLTGTIPRTKQTYIGTYEWDEGVGDPMPVLLEISIVPMSRQKLRFTGYHEYLCGNTVPVSGEIEISTGNFSMLENNAEPLQDFVSNGVFIGSMSTDLRNITATWTPNDDSDTGSLTHTLATRSAVEGYELTRSRNCPQ